MSRILRGLARTFSLLRIGVVCSVGAFVLLMFGTTPGGQPTLKGAALQVGAALFVFGLVLVLVAMLVHIVRRDVILPRRQARATRRGFEVVMTMPARHDRNGP